MSLIHVIHENDAWVEPLCAAFAEQSLPYEEWFLDKGMLDFSSEPPQGVFYNRMSASSHTRDHRHAVEYTSCVLPWLELHGRRVVNGSRALALEINKIAQYAELEKAGVRVPRTLAAVGGQGIIAAARKMEGSFITKHNRAGKGLGVRLFHSVETLESYVASPVFEDSVDGVTLVQEYIKAPEPFITRVEFVGRKFLYAVRVDTTLGFELCPADVCEIGDAMCPVGEKPSAEAPRFQVIENFDHPVIERYRRVLEANDIEVAGVEFITDAKGELYTYDINTNTNYNSAAEERAGKFGMRAVAAFLGQELRRLERPRIGEAAE
ncbi:MAG TPA: hypothetical protein VM051_06840 [Usitatibacter sp.]|nr:hypothetical protein [Usitatibacter sp.]